MSVLKVLARGAEDKLYVDDVFSAYTYTGNSSTQNIVNGINLSVHGGIVWLKGRNLAVPNNIWDTAGGIASGPLETDNTNQRYTNTPKTLTAFNTDGFSMQDDSATFGENVSGRSQVSWTFRNAPKFYYHTTVVKSAGSNATVDLTTLGTVGMVRVKRTDAADGSWYIWHRSLTAGKLLIGETTAAEATLGHITVSGTTVTLVNGVIADGTYLVEGFAHDTGVDGMIQCGSFTTDASGKAVVNLGWESQWMISKNIQAAAIYDGWNIFDTSRGFSYGYTEQLLANSTQGWASFNPQTIPTAVGFASQGTFDASNMYIYVAVRRPNKPPTSGTQVYNAIARTGTGAAATVTGVGFAPDWIITAAKSGTYIYTPAVFSKLVGANIVAYTSASDAEASLPNSLTSFNPAGFSVGTDIYTVNETGINYINWAFCRKPKVFDVICYTGTGANKTETHNLTVAPELWFVKGRNGGTSWCVGCTALTNTQYLVMETAAAKATDATAWNSTFPTASVISIGSKTETNFNNQNFVAYLFATLAGISKVGSFTGNGSSQTINCGFTTGARFILIKRTDSTGDWYVCDTVRGIVAGNDPHLSLNTTAAEVTTDDSIDPDSSGFIVNELAATHINVNAATYIYLAFA